MRNKSIKKHILISISLLSVLVLLISSIMLITGVNANYNPTAQDQITLKFTQGSYPVFETVDASISITGNSAVTGVFNDAQATVSVNSSNCIILPDTVQKGADISGITLLKADGDEGRLDAETYKFADSYYSFTGWKIVSADTKIPGETVFQPGDTVTFDVLEQYVQSVTDGNTGVTTNTLELEAVWGKCYFIQNPYPKMVYPTTSTNTFAYSEVESKTASGGIEALSNDANDGLTPDTPKSTIDNLYATYLHPMGNYYDAFSVVVMLSGELDYVKDTGNSSRYYGYVTNPDPAIFTSATYKSLQRANGVESPGKVWTYNYKPNNKSNYSHCNFRFDNVNFLRYENTHPDWYHQLYKSGYSSDAHKSQFGYVEGNADSGEYIGYEFDITNSAHSGQNLYFEYTARTNDRTNPEFPEYRLDAIDSLRSGLCQNIVLNGGHIGAVYIAWNSSMARQEIDRTYRIGRNAYITAYTVLANNNSAVETNGNFDLFVTGGYAGTIYGTARAGANAEVINTGNRNIYILGDDNKAALNYTIKAVTVSQTTNQNGETVSTETDASKSFSLKQYSPKTAAIYAVYNSSLNNGNVKVLINNNDSTGAVYGTYSGAVSGSVDIDIISGKTGAVYGTNSGAVSGSIDIDISDSNTTGVVYGTNSGNVSGSVDIDISDSTITGNMGATYNGDILGAANVNINNSKTAKVYISEGDGNVTGDCKIVIANNSNTGAVHSTNGGIISGNVDVDITDSSTGAIYGTYGGEVRGALGIDIDIINSKSSGSVYGTYGGDITGDVYVDITNNSTANNSVYGTYSGNVLGSVYINITENSEISRSVFGTYSGDITGDVYVDVTNSTVNEFVYGAYNGNAGSIYINITENSKINNAVYSGGFSDNIISKDVNINISASTTANVYGGAKSATASVEGDVLVNIIENSIVGTVYTAGDAGAALGDVTLNVENSKAVNIYGGAYSGNYAGIPVVTIENSTVSKNAYGGGAYGDVGGTDITVTNCTVNGKLFGGSNGINPEDNSQVGNVLGNTNLTVSGGTYGYIYGGSESGSITGNVTSAISDITVSNSMLGGNESGDISGSVTTTVLNVTVSNYIYGGSDAGNISGGVTTTVDGASALYIYGGSNSGDISNAVTLNVIDTDEITPFIFVRLFGGSNSGNIGTDATKDTDIITLNLTGATLSHRQSSNIHLFGGSRLGNVFGNVEFNIDNCHLSDELGAVDDGIKIRIAAGNDEGGNIYGNTTLNVNNSTIGSYEKESAKNTSNTATLYGGSYNAGEGVITGNTLVDISGQTTIRGVINGGSGHVNSVINGNTSVLLGENDNANDTVVVNSRIFAGSNAGEIKGKTYLLISNRATTKEDIYGGNSEGGELGTSHISSKEDPTTLIDVYGTAGKWSYAGSLKGNVNGDTRMNIYSAARMVGRVYGGCQAATAKVTGSTYLNFVGNDIDVDTISVGQRVYGGGCNGAVLGSTNVLVQNVTLKITYSQSIYGGGGENANATVGTQLSPGKINIDIVNSNVVNTTANSGVMLFGGSEKGNINADVTINIDETSTIGTDGNSNSYVYGGSNHTAVGATLTGNVTVNVKGTVNGNVYGGNNENCTINGNVNVNITDNGNVQKLFGGGYGESTTVNGNASVTVSGESAKVSERIFGGGEYGVVTGNVDVLIENAELSMGHGDCIFGGGMGDNATVGTENAANTVDLTINNSIIQSTNGTATRIYGGGEGGEVYADITVNVDSNTVIGKEGYDDSRIYGGSRADALEDSTGNVIEDVSSDITGDITVNTSGTIHGSVFGANREEGTVIGNITVNINGGKLYNVFGGGTGVNDSTETKTVIIGTDATTDKVTVNIRSGSVTENAQTTDYGSLIINKAVYGGGESNCTIYNEVVVNVLGDNLFFPNSPNTPTDSVAPDKIIYRYVKAEGGYSADKLKQSIIDTSTVTENGNNYSITDADYRVSYYGYIVGGGFGTSTQTLNKTTVNVNTGLTQPYIIPNILGGFKGNVEDVEINVTDTPTFYVTGGCWGVSKNDEVGVVNGNTTVNLLGDSAAYDVEGGGWFGDVKGNTNVNIFGTSRVYEYSIGGGVKAGADVYGNSNVTVGETANPNHQMINTNNKYQYKYEGIYTFDHCYPGGWHGITYGSSTMTVNDGYLDGDVYGGGRGQDNNGQTGAVGKLGNDGNSVEGSSANIIIYGGTIDNWIYGGGRYRSATVYGPANIEIYGGTTHKYISGTGTNSSVDSVNIYANAGNHSTYGSSTGQQAIFCSGFRGDVKGDVNAVFEGDCKINSTVYAGCLAGDVVGNVSLTIGGNCTVLKDVFAGNNLSGTIHGDSTLTLKDNAKVLGTTVNYGANSVIGTVTYGNVYGGCNGTVISKNANDEITEAENDGDVHTELNKDTAGGIIEGKTTINITDNVTIANNVYGASKTLGYTNSDTEVNISGNAQIGNTVYGGGRDAAHSGSTYLNISGSASVTNCVYGGGFGDSATVEGSTNIKIFETAQIGVIDSSITDGIIYGGGESGNVLQNTNIDIYDNAVVTRTVFGGCTSGDVSGNTNINIYGSAIIYYNIYAGGYDGKITGDTNLEIKGSAIVGNDANSTDDGYVYGGGYNGIVSCNTNVSVLENSKVSHTLYGGGFGVNATVEGDTNATINGVNGRNIIINDVYGGGNKGSVNGNTNIFLKEGTVGRDFYGGGNTATVYKDTNIEISGGMIDDWMYAGGLSGNVIGTANTTITGGICDGLVTGGGNKGDVGAVNITVTGGSLNQYGSRNHNTFCGGYSGDVLGDVNAVFEGDCDVTRAIYGGGLSGNVNGNIYLTVNSTGSLKQSVYGGGLAGDVGGDIELTIGPNAIITKNVFGGNNLAGNVFGDVNMYVFGTVNDSVYGGNNGTVVTTDANGKVTQAEDDNSSPGKLKNGALVNGVITVNVGNTAKVNGSVYGASKSIGYTTNVLTVNIAGDIGNSVYGGGYNALHDGDTVINMLTFANVNKNVYGGGFGSTASVENTTVNMVEALNGVMPLVDENAPVVLGNIYGGGENGTAKSTEITINYGVIGSDSDDTSGNVFGGGKGINATVYQSTNVTVDIDHGFTAVETPITTGSVTSGQIETQITPEIHDYAQFIYGSVYGGGDLGAVGNGYVITGTNKANVTSAGTTNVTIKNGHIMGSVFGGGRGKPEEGVAYKLQMGAVFGSTNINVYGGYIAGNNGTGGVYGGGEQSRVYAKDEELATVVNVDCNVEGTAQQIAIYGSVFGGGDRGSGTAINASVPTTIGDVKVNIIGNTTPDESGNPTPIYFQSGGVYGDGNLCLASGYRTITIKNFGVGNYNTTGVAGEKMLKTFYSVQRADEVILDNTDIVLIGANDLVDDSDNTLYSINRVSNLYMKNGSTFKLDSIVKYLGGLHSDYNNDRKYIDRGYNGITNEYQGHGGSAENINKLTDGEISVYRANEAGNTGDFDKQNTVCVANGLYLDVMDENGNFGPVKGLFTLELLYANPGEGGGFVYGSIEQSTGDFICTTKLSESDSYMEIIDNVGKPVGSSEFTYYYWYISGAFINYNMYVEGYIGTDETQFSDTATAADQAETLRYALEKVAVNDILNTAISSNYTLVSSVASGLENNEIAIELKLAGQSLGFLTKIADDKWGITNSKGQVVTGLEGVRDGDGNIADNQIGTNTLYTGLVNSAQGNNTIEAVLHRATSVSTTIEDMGVELVLKMFAQDSNQPPQDSTHTYNFDISLSIVRILPTQSVYYENIRSYIGASTQSPIHINEYSAFTVEYQTNYVPRTFTKTADKEMSWSLDTSSLPQGTKITMADMTASVPTYYYYILQTEEKVNLLDFMQMGTTQKIRNLDATPAFIAEYNEQQSDSLKERLLFVFDFEEVGNNWSWSQENDFAGKVTLNHMYVTEGESQEIMNYTDGDKESTVESVDYHVYNDVEGVQSFTMQFAEESYSEKGVAELNVSLLESTVAVDTRYYEGEFGIKLQMYINDTLVNMPDGITFECNGETFLPDSENSYAVVGVNAFGNHTIKVDTSRFGITSKTVSEGDIVELRATVYSAPEPTYHNSIITTQTDEATAKFTIGVSKLYNISVVTDNSLTDLLVKADEKLKFKLTTAQQNDDEAVVTVRAYKKQDDNFNQRVALASLFTDSGYQLEQANEQTNYQWTIDTDAEVGTYRLVFTFGNKTEYLYFIVN